MKATCSTPEFAQAMQIMCNIVDSSTTKPILADVKIVAEEDGIELSATDLEVGMIYHVPNVSVEEPGQVVVPGQKTSEILRTSPDDSLVFSTQDKSLIIEGNDSYFRVLGEDPSLFPEVPSFPEEEECLLVAKDDLLEMIAKTVFATADERTRYALNGVQMRINGQKIMMVATDGRRLSLVEKKCENLAKYESSVIVPTKALNQILRMVSDEEEQVRIRVEENRILVGSQRGALFAMLVEGQFPDYETVIPTDFKLTVELPVPQFQSAVARSALLATEESAAVKLLFEDNRLTITSHDPQRGESKVSMGVKYDADPFQIAFNPYFIEDMLKAANAETVDIRLNDPKSAAVFSDQRDMTYVIMPLDV